jgi:signal transduction histidine kinase
MRLSRFLIDNLEEILQGWEDFARLLPPGHLMSVAALRDDAERMLRFIAQDLETEQSDEQEVAKSKGHGAEIEPGRHSAAMDHGLARALDRFSLPEMVSEYRALRASVTRLWLARTPTTYDNVVQLVRFNEAVDQILAESVVCFTRKLDSDAELFTASIGHDLRNPLNAVVTSAELLNTSASLSNADREASARIARAATRIAAMLDELHDFTRVRLGGTIAYRREPTDIGKLCEELVDEALAPHPGRRIVLTRSGDTTAHVDRARVAQLVANLIGNAIQHGSEAREITIGVAGRDSDVTIEVHNEGPPIGAEELQTIFEPLRRGRRREPEGERSLGLGLHIARTIAVAHGGAIDVTSHAHAGTTFVVRLPRSGYPS